MEIVNNYIDGEQTSSNQEVYGGGGGGFIDGPSKGLGNIAHSGGARPGGSTNGSGRGGFIYDFVDTASLRSGTTGLANLGGGGGGGDGDFSGAAGGANGASGVVIIRYIDSAVDASGGTEATYSI